MKNPKAKVVTAITIDFIEHVCACLRAGKPVRHKLAGGGILHIDRILPFLCVYRHRPGASDDGTAGLVQGQASYLILPAGQQFQAGVGRLVYHLVETMAKECEAFFLLEIWTSLRDPQANDSSPRLRPAFFTVISSKIRPPTTTLETLVKALARMKTLKKRADVRLTYREKRHPPGLRSLMSVADSRKLNCFIVGLEVEPIFRDQTTNALFPVVHHNLHRELAQAIRRAVFEFSHSQTSLRPVHYQALGRRAVVKAVWEVDRMLAEVSDTFGFLFQVTPVNIDWAWTEFKKRQFERMPRLHYRPLPIDVALMKRQLYDVPIERVEDPTLNFLFREKLIELDRQLSMLRDRGKRAFLYGSLQLFGEVSQALVQVATGILNDLSRQKREDGGGKVLRAPAFAARARKELEYYRRLYPRMASSVEVRDDIVGLMVSQGNLLVGQDVRIPESRVEALIQHEVGTHVVTYLNGKAQPFHQLYHGLAGYDEVQEGLAVLAEYFVDGLSAARLRLLAGRVIAAKCLVDGATFIETFRRLIDEHGFDERTAFTITVRIYRGGGLTKDAVYLRGLLSVMNYLKKGGELDPLFVGKIAASHIPIVKELQWREVLQPAPLKPRYLGLPGAAAKLKKLRAGVSVLDLVVET